MIVRGHPARLPGQPVIILFCERVRYNAGALFDGLVFFQPLRDTSPEWKRFGAGVAGGWKTLVASGRERGDISGTEIIKRFIKRFRVDVAVGGVRADVAEVSVPG